MFYKIFIPIFSVFVLLSFNVNKTKTTKVAANKGVVSNVTSSIDSKIQLVYDSLQTNQFQLPKEECFAQALKGFYALKEKGVIKRDILTLVDFSLSSNEKRLWIIDLCANKILFQSLVAHGKNTGDEYANNFSNSPDSFKSSLGFYATGEVYYGIHGISLKLDGLERGINDYARKRAVVMHGADYVSESFIKGHKRLGRSLGCPAVPVEFASEIISLIKDHSCLYIYHPCLIHSNESKLIS